MTYSLVRLRKLIRQINVRNTDSAITNTLGVAMDKRFIKSIANLSTVDLSNYKVLRTGQFGCILMKVGRDGRSSIALLKDEDGIISPAYYVFEIIDSNKLLPDYLMMFLSIPETDRREWFMSDAGMRGSLEWDRFLDLEVPLPPIEKQQEYVAIYNNLLKLSNNHEKSFSDLQLITNTFTEKLVVKYGTEELGNYIEVTDIRNSDNALGEKDLRGISTSKVFIQSKANTTGVSFANYKVVKSGQFAYVADTSRRGDKIALAFNDNRPYIISSIYTTFEIANADKILPEFLLLWFKRPEFDRYARYNSWGSARETFDWSEMRRVRLPIPPISVQKSIVAIYHVLEARKHLAERLKTTIKEISPILIKDVRDRVLEAIA